MHSYDPPQYIVTVTSTSDLLPDIQFEICKYDMAKGINLATEKNIGELVPYCIIGVHVCSTPAKSTKTEIKTCRFLSNYNAINLIFC